MKKFFMFSLVAVAAFASVQAQEVDAALSAPGIEVIAEKQTTVSVTTAPGRVAAAKKYLNDVVTYVKTLNAAQAKAFLSENKKAIAAAVALVGGGYIVYKLTRKYCPYFKAEAQSAKRIDFIA